MKILNWNPYKNDQLKNERNISFEDIINAIEDDNIIEVYEHPNQERYPGQKIYAIELNDYIYLVPFIENNDEIFLKTIIPSRKATKKYMEDKDE